MATTLSLSSHRVVTVSHCLWLWTCSVGCDAVFNVNTPIIRMIYCTLGTGILLRWHFIKSKLFKGTISDSLGLRKIFKLFRNKEKYLSITTWTIFPQKSHRFDRKTAFHQISSHGPRALFFYQGKISLIFRMKFHVSLSIKHIKPKKLVLLLQMEKIH